MAILTYFIAAVLQPFCLYMILGVVLKKRWERMPLWVHSALATLALQPPTILRGMTTEYYDLMGYIQLIVMLGSVIVIFGDKLWVKVFSIILYYLLAIVAEVIVFATLGDWAVGVDVYGNGVDALILQLFATLIVYSLLGIAVVLWNMLLKRGYTPKHFWVFTLFPISQICMMNSWSKQIHAGEVSYQSLLEVFIGLSIGFIADAILFWVMFMQGEKEQIKRQLIETEQQMKLEKQYYQSLWERQEEMSRIRHDFNNQLTAAMQMADAGESDRSKEMLCELKQHIAETGNTWCDNAVINAVLSHKEQICQQAGVELTADISLTQTISVGQLELCSVLANLIDNAIEAAKECVDVQASIQVKVFIKGRYLYTKVINTAKKPEKKTPREGRGYGMQIISKIATQYNGEYQAYWENGIYTALVVLECVV